MTSKNRAAVHLGKKSVEARKKRLGEQGFKDRMKEISHKRKLFTVLEHQTLDIIPNEE